ncbi:MAG: outer membrane lipoprotein carrier protein LolA [Alphaproteobacteria bacterium]|nr:outer membrane lipoprotein carrier protein LolA [Alphaproteobacteria bacterium]
MRNRFVLALFLGLAVLSVDAVAAKTAFAPELRAAIDRAENYLNRLTTIRARFVQVGPNGELSEGDVYLARPGRMRIEYDPPVPLLLIAADDWLAYQDKELEEVTYLPLSSTPASFLLQEKIRLSGEITVTEVEKTPGAVRIQLTETNDPKAGKLTLVFSEAPFALRQWEVTDAQGLTTRVGLLNAEFGQTFDPDLFELRDPYKKRKPGPRRR